MPYTQYSKAAVLIDLEDIRRVLEPGMNGPGNVVDAAQELIDGLRSRLRERNAQITLARAFAEFDAFTDEGMGVERALYAAGIEPHYAPRSLDGCAVEVQLTIDACTLLHARPDVESIVLVTGSRTYLPLVQHLRASGRRVYLAPMHRLSDVTTPGLLLDHVLYPGHTENKGAGRREASRNTLEQEQHSTDTIPTTTSADDRQDVVYKRIETDLCRQAVQIIDTHFGQYEEIYLTPLLRKLSEEFAYDNCDPKAIVSDLEEAGLVWLEKRQGYPYDYTVLLIDDNHPDAPPRFSTDDDEDLSYDEPFDSGDGQSAY